MPVNENIGEHPAKVLREKIYNRSAKVSIIGLGYVGLPLAVEQAKIGFPVLGIDLDSCKVKHINNGKSYIRDVAGEDIFKLVEGGRLKASSQFDNIKEADVIIICVPTPLKSMRVPDLSFVLSATREVANQIKKGQLISLESTTFPGTTQEVILPILEASGLTVGSDFFLSFSPERVDPGNKYYTTRDISKVVGGVTPLCREMASTFYSQGLKQVVPVSSPDTAEMTKIFENTYRSVNIALVNEFMILCDRMNIDVWEVVEAAATKPFGIQTFFPGPGVGGHCIPVDPVYLAWKAKDFDFHTRFIDLAEEINMQASEHVVKKLISVLNRQKKCLNGSRILILGITYKKDIDDVRESPALKIIDYLNKNQAEVVYYDPYVPRFQLSSENDKYMESISISEEELAKADSVLILTDHSCIEYQWVVDHAKLILDARNATKKVQRGKEKITKI
ncbi:nucleotide sugar dehydrogenase [Pelotomaculum propionicicum]|uniref:UDP-N-acetyl-D-glucosamine 6-dehydrogenase n=1 Tax=Pelotomaculum propionicicum TaxID=258475 RepID=A0A4Y7RNG7_9FIRM|nr:nucleotide sugar dehydrogenase [Pelotomaculum propionicicum]TEB10346.1 UDP-N-acetyl-D-glucosamine 6-dehydrogenase [Pelotomaculum propionicicum]